MDVYLVIGLILVSCAAVFLVVTVYSIFFTHQRAYELWCSLIDFSFHDHRDFGDRAKWMDAQTSFAEMCSYRNTFKNPEEFIAGKYAQEFFVWRENPVDFKRVSEPPHLRIIN